MFLLSSRARSSRRMRNICPLLSQRSELARLPQKISSPTQAESEQKEQETLLEKTQEGEFFDDVVAKMLENTSVGTVLKLNQQNQKCNQRQRRTRSRLGSVSRPCLRSASNGRSCDRRSPIQEDARQLQGLQVFTVQEGHIAKDCLNRKVEAQQNDAQMAAQWESEEPERDIQAKI